MARTMPLGHHFLIHTLIKSTTPNPRLARTKPGGSGIVAATKERLGSAWNWKSGPETPLIEPVLAMTLGGPPPAWSVNNAEGIPGLNGVTSEELNESWLTGVLKNAGSNEVTSALISAEP